MGPILGSVVTPAVTSVTGSPEVTVREAVGGGVDVAVPKVVVAPILRGEGERAAAVAGDELDHVIAGGHLRQGVAPVGGGAGRCGRHGGAVGVARGVQVHGHGAVGVGALVGIEDAVGVGVVEHDRGDAGQFVESRVEAPEPRLTS